MKTSNEIRRENLALLVTAAGGVTAFAALIGKSQSQVSQWLNASPDFKTGKPRQVSDPSARQIETACRLSRGWMDQPHEGEEVTLGTVQTTDRFYSLAALSDRAGLEYADFRRRVLSLTAIPAPPPP